MANFNFASENDMIDFVLKLSHVVEGETIPFFDNWEIMHLSIHAPLGLKLNLNTKIINPSSNEEFMTFRRIKNIVQMFAEENNLSGSDIDMRLRCPQIIKQNIDKDNNFINFNLNFFSSSGVIVLTNTELEKKLPSPVETIESWTGYVTKLIENWQKQNNQNTI